MPIKIISGWTAKLFLLFCLLASTMFPAGAMAANLVVDCSGQTPGAFTCLDQLKRSVTASNFTDAEKIETLRSAGIWAEPLRAGEV